MNTTALRTALYTSKPWIGLAIALAWLAPAHAAVYRYENATSGTIPETTSANCQANGLLRTFTVSQSFSVSSIALGFNATHATRGQIRAILQAPGGGSQVFLVGASSGEDADNGYDILMSTNTESALDDGSNDVTAEPYFNRLVQVTGANFTTGSAAGTWNLYVCDVDTQGALGTFNRARLILSDGVATAPAVCTSTTSYNWGLHGDNAGYANGATVVTADGVTMTYVGFQDPTTDRAGYDVFGTSLTTQTNTLGGDAGIFFMGMDLEADEYESGMLRTNWSFSPAVSGLQFAILDVDRGPNSNNWEDHVRVGAPDATTPTVPYTVTLGTAHQVAGDTVEGDGDVPHGQFTNTAANATFRFAGPVTTFSVEYRAGDDYDSPSVQYLAIGDPSWCAFDLGDAPSSYGTSIASGGARHLLADRDVYLGTTPPDGEVTDPSGAGTTDDTTTVPSGPDDEDGVASFPLYTPGSTTYSVTVSASNASGAAAYLVGYIDWNRDGDFADPDERSATVTVPNGSVADDFTVTWSSVPVNAGGDTETYARFRISGTAAAAESPTGQAPDGEVEDYLIPVSTLPITLAWVETAERGDTLEIAFMTATERGNAGFMVWGVGTTGEQTLLARVPSAGVNSSAPQSYRVEVAAADVQAVLIEDVAIDGRNRLHGPFAVGHEYGEKPEPGRLDWARIKEESAVVSDADLLAFASGRAPETSALGLASAQGRVPTARVARAGTVEALLLVGEEGIHRVTHEELLAAGVDLGGQLTGDIAVLDDGVPVARFVREGPMMGPIPRFGAGSYIEFLARPKLTLASPVDVYELRLDPRSAVTPADLGPGGGGTVAVEAVDRYHADRLYSFASPTSDPWYEEELLAFGSPDSASRAFDLPDLAGGEIELTLELWGSANLEGAEPDHHVIVRLNGTEIASDRFDGITPWSRTFDVTSLALPSGNTLEVAVPGDTGYEFDLICVEGFSVRYSRWSVARDGRFHARLAGLGGSTVNGFAPGQTVAAWHQGNGGVSRGEFPPEFARSVPLPPLEGEVFLAEGTRLLHPAIVPEVPKPLFSSGAEYLIVTHRAFADSLDALVSLERSRGLVTEVVTTDRIFAAYSDHASSPDAVRRFVAASLGSGRLRYLLLVGADTVDPWDHLGLGSVSFVPTAYAKVGPVVTYSPADEVLADADGDGIGEVPVGRLPVRTPAEVDAVVAKLVAWEGTARQPRVLLTSGASDAGRRLSAINETYGGELSGWDAALAQVDDIGTGAVRDATLGALNAGVPLVSFVGHSSPGQWDFSPILRWQDVATLANAGAPNLVAQWGCWNSYAVDPAVQALSSHLLLAPEAGAASVIGAATLTTDASHERLGRLFFEQVNGGATTVGDAFLAAKRALRQENVAQDAILGMCLFGDPATTLPAAAAGR